MTLTEMLQKFYILFKNYEILVIILKNKNTKFKWE